MKKLSVITLAVLFLAMQAFAAEGSDAKKSKDHETATTPFSVGVGVNVSTLGIGGEVALPVSHRVNTRFGFNAFNYNHAFNASDIDYKGTLNLRSATAKLDFFPWAGSFHLSPGLMFYNGNKFGADAIVKPGNSFDLNNVSYTSSTADPLKGTGKLELAKVGPMFMFGWGNLVPRKAGKRFSFSFEAGIVYQSSPAIKLNFTGSACDATGHCQPVNTFTTFQSDRVKEEKRLTDKVSPFRFYPVISTGFGYHF